MHNVKLVRFQIFSEGLFWDLGRFVKKEGEVCQKGGGDLKKGFLAGHRLQIKDNLYMKALSM